MLRLRGNGRSFAAMRKTPTVAVDDLKPKILKPKTSGMTFSTSRASATANSAVGREPDVKLGKTAAGPEFSALAQASILIVDDEPGMRNFLVRTLAPRCKLVDEAADTDQASRKLDSNRYDVVILDNIMPGNEGIEECP
ncbi:PleD family two-component response regulator [Bradyrhizobium liaoningense]